MGSQGGYVGWFLGFVVVACSQGMLVYKVRILLFFFNTYFPGIILLVFFLFVCLVGWLVFVFLFCFVFVFVF